VSPSPPSLEVPSLATATLTPVTFVTNSDGSLDRFVTDADGNNVVQLTDDEAFDTFPIWSPDGDAILFFSRDIG
jgi:Tol biopolymer transport system component